MIKERMVEDDIMANKHILDNAWKAGFEKGKEHTLLQMRDDINKVLGKAKFETSS